MIVTYAEEFMKEDIELPRRGYDTQDLEAMSRAMDGPDGRAGRRGMVMMVLASAIATAIWLLVGR